MEETLHNYVKTYYHNKKVLITGGAGFIGSHLVDCMVDAGAHVTVLDNFSSGSIANLENTLAKIKLITGDIRDRQTCLLATEGQQHVFHLAAFVSVPQSHEDPHTCNEINITGTENMLNASAAHMVQSFVFSSSSAVYGNRLTPCHETDQPHPESIYGMSKLSGEKLCAFYGEKRAFSVACLRYFNVYGPRQKAEQPHAPVVAQFMHALQKRLPLTIFGDGKQTRDFIHVKEVVLANAIVGTILNLQAEIFNIARGQSINLLQLLEKLEEEMGITRTTLNFIPTRAGEITHSAADCTKYYHLMETVAHKEAIFPSSPMVREADRPGQKMIENY